MDYMYQLSFFSLDGEPINIPKKRKVISSRKIIDFKTRLYKFDFQFTINKIKELNYIRPKTFKTNLEIGMYLKELRDQQPTTVNENGEIITFWEYISEYKLDDFESFLNIRAFEIVELLQSKGFKLLPNDSNQTFMLEKYSDDQIVEIWEILTSHYKSKEPNDYIIEKIISTLSKHKALETIDSSNTSYSYANYAHTVFQKNAIDFIEQNTDYRSEITSLKRTIENLKSELSNHYYSNNYSSNSFHTKDTKEKYLNILGLRDNYTQQELKDIYRQLSKIYHPDVNSDKKDVIKKSFENQFMLIKEAYEYLLN